MQHRPFSQRLRQLSLLLSLLFCLFLGCRSLPRLQPALHSSLNLLALTSALGTQPQRSAALLREKIISLEDNSPEDIPVVDSFVEETPPLPPVIEELPTLPIQEDSPSPPEEEETPPSIPVEYQGPILEEQLSGEAKVGFPTYGKTLIKNATDLSDEEVAAIAAAPHNLNIRNGGPQVLLYHTHATESFEPYDRDIYDTRGTWRSTDPDENLIAVGEAMKTAMEAHGISVLHDTTLHDYPSYNGSYERSAETIQDYLDQYPSLCVLLDIHRDAIQREETLVKPVTTINGEKVAQLMLIAGCDSRGTLNIPTWKDNLRFGARLQDQIEEQYPGLCRPLYLAYRKYNQDLSNASLLLEVGSHGNTLEEAIRCGKLAGDTIGAYLAELLMPAGAEAPPS